MPEILLENPNAHNVSIQQATVQPTTVQLENASVDKSYDKELWETVWRILCYRTVVMI